MEFKYDPEHSLSYGYYICETCGSKFFGGGRAIHNRDCSKANEGYNCCVYMFGPEEVKYIKRLGYSPNGPFDLTLEFLEKNFPELVKD